MGGRLSSTYKYICGARWINHFLSIQVHPNYLRRLIRLTLGVKHYMEWGLIIDTYMCAHYALLSSVDTNHGCTSTYSRAMINGGCSFLWSIWRLISFHILSFEAAHFILLMHILSWICGVREAIPIGFSCAGRGFLYSNQFYYSRDCTAHIAGRGRCSG